MNRLNRLFDGFLLFAKTGTPRRQMAFFLISSLVLIVLLYVFAGAVPLADTESYFSAGRVFLAGKLDYARTPLYPLYLMFCNFAGGGWAVAAGQTAVFLLSIVYFYRTLENIGASRGETFLFTAFYVYSFAIGTVVTIMTESFAISMTVFLLYNVVSVWQSGKISAVWWTNFWLVMLMLLRPAFIFLLLLAPLWWLAAIVVRRKCWKRYLCGLLATVLIFTGFCGYCRAMEREHGVFTPRFISIVNQWWILTLPSCNPFVQEESIMTEKELRGYVDLPAELQVPLYKLADGISAQYGMAKVNQIVSDSIRRNYKKYIKDTIRRFAYADYIFVPGTALRPVFFILPSGIIGRYYEMLILLATVALAHSMLKKEAHTVFDLFLLMWIVGQIFTVVAGAPLDFGRLSAVTYPIMLLLLLRLCRRVSISWRPLTVGGNDSRSEKRQA